MEEANYFAGHDDYEATMDHLKEQYDDMEKECPHCHELYVAFHMCRDDQESEDAQLAVR